MNIVIDVSEIRFELLAISYADHDRTENRTSFMDEKVLPRVKELGEELNRIGGLSLMSAICESMPIYDIRILEVAWDGIGDWRC